MRQASQSEIREIQLTILDTVHEFCKSSGITYYLIAGTLLGAVRHGGYIPWDDDIDIAMFREDYYKFIENFNRFNPGFQVYSIEKSEGYNYFFAKISYEKSLQIDTNVAFLDIPIGINIDLFPIDKLPMDTSGNKILKRLNCLDKIFYCKAYKFGKNKPPLKRIFLILLIKFLSVFVSKKKLGLKQAKIAKQFNSVELSTYSFICCGPKKRLPLFTKDLFKPIEMTFEGRKYIAPKGYDIILKGIYGDYMILPPIEKRLSVHSFTAYLKEV